MNTKRTKRTTQETMDAVEKAKEMVKNGTPVNEALREMKLQPSSWYKYKGKRKPYEKKPIVVNEIEPIKLSGGKTMFVLTDDPEVIARMMEKLS